MKIPILQEWARRRQQRPKFPPARATSLIAREKDPRLPATPAPAPLESVGGNLFSTTLAGQELTWMGTNKSDFYRYIRDHVPLLSSAVWTWVHLCATPQSYLIEGDENAKKEAQRILTAMDNRILDNPTRRVPAVHHLVQQFLTELFTIGRYGATYILSKDGKSIETIKQHSTDLIKWKFQDNRWLPYFEAPEPSKVKTQDIALDVQTFFWATLQSDINNPMGIEPLASIPFVAQIQEALAFDMAKSSHTAGTPRLHIQVTPPPSFPHESEKEYQQRINTYFDDTVSAFNNLDPEDMLFTWNDVTVKIVGGDQGRNFAWRINREQIVEDVITGLHLYPWVLGRSHGTTKNWVESQFNVLMQVIATVQGLASGYADWIRNTELKLAGNPCTTRHIFAPNQDPFILNKMNARRQEFETIDLMVRRGYIPKDEGARRLGLPSAFRQDPDKEPAPDGTPPQGPERTQK